MENSETESENFVSLNDATMLAEAAGLSALSNAALYGKGIFTTIAVADGRAVFPEKHRRRLEDNSARIGIELPDTTDLFNSLDQIIQTNKLSRGRARVTVFDESAASLWSTNQRVRSSVLITTAEPRAHSAVFRIDLSPYAVNSRSPLAGIKTCNYLEQTLARDAARLKGFDEAIRLNERGEISSAAMANIFWVKNGAIFTPALEAGCLAGTTREFVLENFEVVEVLEGIETVESADEIFLTSAGIGIRPAVLGDDKRLPAAITARVRESFEQELDHDR
jgi:branched-subunit amino acid aminotransferase/4-amino-4-deoxychorismate lyase